MKNFFKALRVGALAAVLVGAAIISAKADAFVGFLSDCTAVTATSCTELTATGYSRQPIAMTDMVYGKTVNSIPFSFLQTATGTVVGRGLYDALTGGNLIAVIPLATSISLSTPGDRGDVGAIAFTLTSQATIFSSKFSQGTLTSGATIGTSSDGSSVTAATGLTMTRGQIYKTGTVTW
jgi:hypothetical protein